MSVDRELVPEGIEEGGTDKTAIGVIFGVIVIALIVMISIGAGKGIGDFLANYIVLPVMDLMDENEQIEVVEKTVTIPVTPPEPVNEIAEYYLRLNDGVDIMVQIKTVTSNMMILLEERKWDIKKELLEISSEYSTDDLIGKNRMSFIDRCESSIQQKYGIDLYDFEIQFPAYVMGRIESLLKAKHEIEVAKAQVEMMELRAEAEMMKLVNDRKIAEAAAYENHKLRMVKIKLESEEKKLIKELQGK